MPGRKRGGHGMPRGFVSTAQWRYFYANPKLRKLAHKEAHKAQAVGGGPKVAYRHLPKHKGVRTRSRI